MKISVIMPVYNSEQYLTKAINSVLVQTLTDFELILVDDGSTDESGKLCDNFSKVDKRVKVLHQKNQGQAVARNNALDIAKGDYIAFVDSDDYIHPEMFEVLLNNILLTDADISICSYIQGDKSDFNFDSVKILDECKTYKGVDFLKKSLIDKYGKGWILCDKIFKRECFTGIRMPVGRINEDNAVVYKMIYNAKKVVDCNNVLYYYFMRQNSTVNETFSLKHLDWLTVLEEMIEFFTYKKEQELLEWANISYINSLADCYKKVRNNCPDKAAEYELKRKLKVQYKIMRKYCEISLRTYPGVYEELFPFKSVCYWNLCRIKNKLLVK